MEIYSSRLVATLALVVSGLISDGKETLCGRREEGVFYRGNDIGSKKPARSVDVCYWMCQSEDKCMVWSYFAAFKRWRLISWIFKPPQMFPEVCSLWQL